MEVIFGYPGGSVLPIYDALYRSKINMVLVRTEQGGVHAASGYARVTGKVGVCLATSGPGATNLVTGIATAYMDSIPIVAITGQVATSMVGTDAFQEVDITGITIPITKYNYLVKRVEDLPGIMKEAFHLAASGRPGPVLIDIPRNVADAVVEMPEELRLDIPGYKPTYKGHPTQIKSAAALIDQSERPVIYAGGGVISSGATEELRQLAERIQAPVTTTLMGIGSFPTEHTLSIGMLGLHGLPCANFAVSEADLLIGIGVRFDDRVTGAVSKFAPKAKIVHIDIDPAEIGKNVEVDLPIVGDAKRILNEILARVAENKHGSWLEQVDDWKRDYPLCYQGREVPAQPQFVLEEMGRLINREAVITTDVGQHQMWAAQYCRVNQPRTFLSSGGLGTMGYGFPAAIGAQLGKPDALVVAVTGDGSFQMNMPELGTACDHNLPIKILLFNNHTLGMVKQLQHFYSNRVYAGVEFRTMPDFTELARAYGAVGCRISSREDVIPVLTEAFGNGKLTLIDCLISPDEMVYPIVLAGRGLNEMVTGEQEGR